MRIYRKSLLSLESTSALLVDDCIFCLFFRIGLMLRSVLRLCCSKDSDMMLDLKSCSTNWDGCDSPSYNSNSQIGGCATSRAHSPAFLGIHFQKVPSIFVDNSNVIACYRSLWNIDVILFCSVRRGEVTYPMQITFNTENIPCIDFVTINSTVLLPNRRAALHEQNHDTVCICNVQLFPVVHLLHRNIRALTYLFVLVSKNLELTMGLFYMSSQPQPSPQSRLWTPGSYGYYRAVA